MENKKKIKSEIKSNCKFKNFENNKNKFNNRENLIINNNKNNNNLKSNPFNIPSSSNSRRPNKIIDKPYKSFNTKFISNINIKVNYINNNININEKNNKINKILVNTKKNKEKIVKYDNINDSYILNKNKLKKTKININSNNNNINIKQLLNKISSKYILEGIFDYIHDRYFKPKLFRYTNLFQKN